MQHLYWVALAVERARSGHALFGPSTLPRVFRCPGSVRLAIVNNAPIHRESEYAREGSRAHAVAADALMSERDLASYTGLPFGYKEEFFSPDAAMTTALQVYADACNELPGDHYVETTTSLDLWMPLPMQFGTSDFAALYDTTLDVTDLKFGEGEKVFAADNEQLLAYALGFYDE